MSDFKTLLLKKNARMNSVPEALQTVVEKQQQRVLNRIIALVNTLETSGGKIIISSKNIDLIPQIIDELKSVFLNDEYLKAVKAFAAQFETQAQLNVQIIESAGFNISGDLSVANKYLDYMKRNVIKDLIATQEFIRPLQTILDNAVATYADYGETVENIINFVKGEKDVDGRILRYVKSISADAFAVSDRSFTNIVSNAIGAEWYYYSGVELETSRCFCIERVGHYFHKKEIEAWGDGKDIGYCETKPGQWAGWRTGTNETTIFTFLGGWGPCKHSLMPVSFIAVPKSDVDRAIAGGYYKKYA